MCTENNELTRINSPNFSTTYFVSIVAIFFHVKINKFMCAMVDKESKYVTVQKQIFFFYQAMRRYAYFKRRNGKSRWCGFNRILELKFVYRSSSRTVVRIYYVSTQSDHQPIDLVSLCQSLEKKNRKE